MTVETATDREAMLADFGVDATVGRSTVRGILTSPYLEVLDTETPGTATRDHRFMARSGDVAGIARGSTMEIEGTVYKVRSIQPDGTGITELVLGTT